MRFLSSLLIVLVISAVAPAQRTKRPPRELVVQTVLFTKPAVSTLYTFNSATGSYSAVFAGKPVSSRMFENGVVVLTERASRPGSEQRGTMVVFGADLEPDLYYENYRKLISQSAGEASVTESKIKLGGFDGLGFDFSRGTTRRITRAYVEGRRVFEFEFSIDNWPLVAQIPSRVAAVEEEAARFFSSVKINPEPVEEIPFDVLGEWRDREYVNNFLGFRLAFDERLVVIEANEMETMQRGSQKVFKVNDEATRAQLAKSIREEIILGGVREEALGMKTPALIFSVQRVGRYLTIWEIAESSTAAFSRVENYRIVGSFKSANVGPEQYVGWSMQGKIGQFTILQNVFVFLRNGYAVVFVTTSFDEAKSAEYAKLIQKIRWTPRPAPKSLKK